MQESCIMKKGLTPPPPTLSPWYMKYKKLTEISQGNKLYQKLLNNFSVFYFYIGRRKGRRLGERKIPKSFPHLLYFFAQDYLLSCNAVK